MSIRHFLDISTVGGDDLHSILKSAHGMKSAGGNGQPLQGKTLAMIFDKPSTRTRVSFEVGVRQLGGHALILNSADMQLGRGETIADTARVLSRYVDAIMIRANEHSRLLKLAEHATVPVINGLTDDTHPCQIMADIMTMQEKLGDLKGRTIAWSGDGNNVLNSLMEASAIFGYNINIAVPPGHEPNERYLNWAREKGAKINFFKSAQEAVVDADCVVTDTWASMGAEEEAAGHNTFMPYQVNSQLMAKANKDAIFMHCLPAHRGEEVTDEVMDGSQSVVFDEAENRLHAQKAILNWCLDGEI